MKNLKDLEIINISTVNGELIALVSYQDTTNLDNLNNGYDTARIPIRPREIQVSVRGNQLVDQSVKNDVDVVSVSGV
jgi:hypothetical protein